MVSLGLERTVPVVADEVFYTQVMVLRSVDDG